MMYSQHVDHVMWSLLEHMYGSSINDVVKILGIFDPLPPFTMNKAYVIKWSLGYYPLPPQLSTWFMDGPV